ncbi:MAG: Wzz/FepE/Etk N-terminal domain-containing protein, partial [Bacteroidota bacterium]
MYSAQLQVREVLAAARRRWKLILIPTVLVTTLSAIGVYMQPKKYESSTTIILRPDRTLNPMTGYETATAFEEQLRNFYEILYSRTVLLSLADSLGLTTGAKTETERLAIAQALSSNFYSMRLGSNSFRIAYVDTDPGRARRAAQVLANLFIQTKLGVDDRQNALTVQFYEKKVQEYREAFESSVQSWVSEIKQNVNQLPLETRSLYNQLDEIQRGLSAIASRMRTLREALEVLKGLEDELRTDPDVFRSESGKQSLLELQREDLPFVAELKTAVMQY